MSEYKAGDKVDLAEFGFLHLTEEQAEKLNNGESISLDLFTDDNVKEYQLTDLYTSDSWVNANEAPAIHREADSRRVHISKAPKPARINNPAVDPKKLVEEMRKHTDRVRRYNYNPIATDLNYVDPDVAHPSHYTEGRKYEPRDVIRDWGLNFNLGSATKYISRAGRKETKIKDLQKAIQFIQFEIDAVIEESEDD